MGRFRYITETGAECNAENVNALVAAVRAGALRPGQMLFDEASARWHLAEEHDAVAAAFAALGTAPRVAASPPQTAPPSEPIARPQLGVLPREALPSANRRIVARFVDLWVLGLPGAIVLIVLFTPVFGAPSDDFKNVSGALYGAAGMAILDCICVRYSGCTPGKLLLGMRVVSVKAGPLSWTQAAFRAATLWMKGLAFGLPVVFLVTGAISMRRVVRTGRASWDEESNTEVRFRRNA